nr:hypothetical protein [Gimesia maris]
MKRYALNDCLLDHFAGQFLLAAKNDAGGNTGLRETLLIYYPLFRKTQPTIDQRFALRTAITHKDAHLAVVDTTERSRILPGYPHGLLALLGETSLINDQKTIVFAQGFADMLPKFCKHLLIGPDGLGNELLQCAYYPMGQIQPQTPQTYSFPIPGSNLKAANLLEFQVSEEDDGMSLNSPLLTVQGNRVYDPRDAAIREIRTGHWGQGAADWGGFLVGTSAQLEESPFQRKQNEFCFVLTETK